MKVRLLTPTTWEGTYQAKVAVLTVDEAVGARWVRNGLAEAVQPKPGKDKKPD